MVFAFQMDAEDQAVPVVVGLQRRLGRPPSRRRAQTAMGRPGVLHRTRRTLAWR
jgi:hypothetical protein